MTRTTNARVAGVTYLAYIAFGILSMTLFGKATAGTGITEKLAMVAQHSADIRTVALLDVLCAFFALVLGAAWYGITRDEDPDLAILACTCRLVESVSGAISIRPLMTLLWLATATGATAPSAEDVRTLGTFLLRGQGTGVGAIFFAVGNAIFSYLLLRGRMVPVPLAWLGIFASAVCVAGLPFNLIGLFTGPLVWVMWMPMLVFEVTLALWFLTRGVAAPRALSVAH